MTHQIAVYHAFKNGVWMGMGTQAAIAKRGYDCDGIVHYHSKVDFVDGWRDR